MLNGVAMVKAQEHDMLVDLLQTVKHSVIMTYPAHKQGVARDLFLLILRTE